MKMLMKSLLATGAVAWAALAAPAVHADPMYSATLQGLTFTTELDDGPSASTLECDRGGSPDGAICFNLSPDTAFGTVPIDLVHTIVFSAPLDSHIGILRHPMPNATVSLWIF